MLSTIVSMFGAQIVDKLFGNVADIIARWQQKQITDIEAKKEMNLALIGAFKDIEVAYADAISKMFSAFMGAMPQSPVMLRTWAFVTISQGIMLLWFEFGIPFVIAMHWVDKWPSAGTTADWAYALVGSCLGLGLMLGKSSVGIVGGLKSLVGK